MNAIFLLLKGLSITENNLSTVVREIDKGLSIYINEPMKIFNFSIKNSIIKSQKINS